MRNHAPLHWPLSDLSSPTHRSGDITEAWSPPTASFYWNSDSWLRAAPLLTPLALVLLLLCTTSPFDPPDLPWPEEECTEPAGCDAAPHTVAWSYYRSHSPGDTTSALAQRINNPGRLSRRPKSVRCLRQSLCLAVLVACHPNWWHVGIDALGKTRSSCEEGDAVASTRSQGKPSQLTPAFNKAISIRGLAPPPRKAVCVKNSLCPGTGFGLFASKDVCTYADNIRTLEQQRLRKICPYLGDSTQDLHSDYVMRIGDVIVDARSKTSCWARYANDALDASKDNVRAILIDGVIWFVPLDRVELLAGQKIYIAYGWEYWYCKWQQCPAELRARVESRYFIAHSVPHCSASPTKEEQDEHDRVSRFWYGHWAWWTPDMRKQIQRHFKLPTTNTTDDPYRLDADVAEDDG